MYVENTENGPVCFCFSADRPRCFFEYNKPGQTHRTVSCFFTSGAAIFGSESYSKEELVAEIGACALINGLGIETKSSFRNSVAYLQNWLSVLKSDKRFIINAAGLADKAIKLIRGEEEHPAKQDVA